MALERLGKFLRDRITEGMIGGPLSDEKDAITSIDEARKAGIPEVGRDDIFVQNSHVFARVQGKPFLYLDSFDVMGVGLEDEAIGPDVEIDLSETQGRVIFREGYYGVYFDSSKPIRGGMFL